MDALRGLTVAAMLLVNNPGDWGHVHPWLLHAPWHGIAPPDLIFPLFLFIVGVSVALGLGPALERGASPGGLARKAAWRALRILLLGLALHGLAWWLLEPRAFRPMGVLQRIAACYLAVALVAVFVRSVAAQWALFGALLAGYGLLLAAGGSLALWDNAADRIDALLLGAHAYQFDAATGRAHDPEGVLSTLPSIATTLLGLRAGEALRRGALRWLLAAGVAAVAAGGLLALLQPLNKNLWTPSFVLWTGGFSLLLLGAAHRWVDVRGAHPLGRAFGHNAITAYALAWVLGCALGAWSGARGLYAALFAAPLGSFAPWVPSLAYAIVFTALVGIVMLVFDRRGWRITI